MGMVKIDNVLFTVGHSVHTQQHFLNLLKTNEINCVADVRSTPFSRICPQFNRDILKEALQQHGIYYIFMGREFGARREDRGLFTSEGYLDFGKTAESKEFLQGVDRIIKGLQKDLNISFMCTEKDPINCHRNILVAHEFEKLGFQIQNILSDSSTESQQQLENRLLDMYFPDRLQINLFEKSNASLNRKELIEQAYKLRNKDIGYSLYDENGE